ncbi:MAG: hypothetical protein GVY24_01800 [Planctomycetes bacterium]|jgi:hypothetical protein|nr:hypothetical protein [Planctomycetota bacterium]
MSHGKITLAAAAALGTLLGTVHVQAQEEAPAINNGSVSFTIGADVVTEYWFRGIQQENQGFILQPYADVTFALVSNEDYTLDGYFGVWNSLHWGDGTSSTPNNPPGSTGNDDVWYEADFFIGGTLGLGDFGIDFGYTNLYGPNAGGEFAEEIYVGVSYDDSELWGDNFDGVQPYATVIFEIDGGSDGVTGTTGANGRTGEKGTYLELGIEPTFVLTDSADYPMTLGVPVTLGLSLDDYYEYVDGAGNIQDDDFGFLQVGAVVSMPLTMVPAEYGAYEVSAGLYYIMAGEVAEADPFGVTSGGGFDSGDDDSIFASIGISMSY